MKTKIACLCSLLTYTFIYGFCAEVDYEIVINEILNKQTGINENNEYEDLYEYLSDLAENPINLNTASRRELEQFPLLNQYQIEKLMEYIFDYGNLLSIYELNVIDGFDTETVRLCSPFLSTDIPPEKNKLSLKNIFKYGKHNVFGNIYTTVQNKKGYLENIYLGNPFGGYLKYKFNHKNLSFSITCEHDAGEPFINNGGFDFYSAHVMIKNIGSCKALVLGDYKLNFGQGLVLKSNIYYGKSNDPASMIQRQDAISPYTSSTEYGYFRGLANTWSIKKIDVTGFFSYTFYKDNENYHRTINELSSKNSNKKILAGGNIIYNHSKFKIGVTGIHDFSNYKTNIGFDYRTRLGVFDLAGEFALNEKLKPAVLQSVCFSPTPIISVSTLFRYYDPEYESPYGNAYSESKLNDEAGILFGLGLKPLKNWNFSTYIDMFRFFKPKYGIFKPSDGFKFTFDTNYVNGEYFSLYGKYILTVKETDYNDTNENTLKTTARYHKHRFKIVYYVKLLKIIELDGGITSSYTDINENGDFAWVLNNNLKIKLHESGLNFAAGISFFDIKNYIDRIYLYEKGLPYTYSSVMYYNQGVRTYFIVSYNPTKIFSLNFKASHTFYSNKNGTIGSGNETIYGNRKTDLKLMAVFKF